MSLIDDLRSEADNFSKGDDAERGRRKEFMDGWEEKRSSVIVPRFHNVVRLSEDYPWWTAEAEVDNSTDVLRLRFIPACGPAVVHELRFEPNENCTKIHCYTPSDKSTTKYDLAWIDAQEIDNKIRQFFKAFIAAVAPPRPYVGYGQE